LQSLAHVSAEIGRRSASSAHGSTHASRSVHHLPHRVRQRRPCRPSIRDRVDGGTFGSRDRPRVPHLVLHQLPNPVCTLVLTLDTGPPNPHQISAAPLVRQPFPIGSASSPRTTISNSRSHLGSGTVICPQYHPPPTAARCATAASYQHRCNRNRIPRRTQDLPTEPTEQHGASGLDHGQQPRWGCGVADPTSRPLDLAPDGQPALGRIFPNRPPPYHLRASHRCAHPNRLSPARPALIKPPSIPSGTNSGQRTPRRRASRDPSRRSRPILPEDDHPSTTTTPTATSFHAQPPGDPLL